MSPLPPAANGVSPAQIVFRDLWYSVPVASTNAGMMGEEAPSSGKMHRASPFKRKQMVPKSILKGITGTFLPGRVTAILGPSGSGKTTLLNCLAGSVGKGTLKGSVEINGRAIDSSSMRLVSGFVFQDDVILETSTVKEGTLNCSFPVLQRLYR
ncbi:hypothetical protein RI367_003981 [Sorochytrium milnesiophthora]